MKTYNERMTLMIFNSMVSVYDYRSQDSLSQSAGIMNWLIKQHSSLS